MTTTERQKRYRARRKKGGDQRLSIWLDATSIATLNNLAAIHGSRDEAIKQALIIEGDSTDASEQD